MDWGSQNLAVVPRNPAETIFVARVSVQEKVVRRGAVDIPVAQRRRHCQPVEEQVDIEPLLQLLSPQLGRTGPLGCVQGFD